MSAFIPLADLCSKITKGTTPNAKDGGFADSGVNYIKSESLSYDGSIDATKFAFISEETNQRLKRSIIQDGDILYSIAGANLGKCGVARLEHLPANTNQAVAIIRVDERRASSRFISLCLRNPSFVQSVLGGVAQSAQPNVNVADIGRFKMPNLPLPEQRAIAATLGALDDKIELNRKMNATLEAMARALFRDWFVDFGPTLAKMAQAALGGETENTSRAPYLSPNLWSLFPDHMDAEGKPEGWELFRLGDLADHHTRTNSPSDRPNDLFEHFSLPAFDKGQNPALDRGETIKSNKTLVPPGAILLSKLNPEIPRVWLPEAENGHLQIASTEFLAYTGKNGARRGLLFCLFSDDDFRGLLQSMVTGTSKSHQRISPPDLLRREALTGKTELFLRFDELVAPILNRVLANRAESRTIARTRDLLLPRLMSGELRLAEAERITEAAL